MSVKEKNKKVHTPMCPFTGFYNIPIIDEKGNVEHKCIFPSKENKCPYILLILEEINRK